MVIAADVSGSVRPYRAGIERCVKQIVRSCRHSPRADNLLLRLVTFDSQLKEVHGFRPLADCPEDDYTGCIKTGGTTALFDAAYNSIESTTAYGRNLSDHDFDVNVIVFVITDGEDNASSMTATTVADALTRAVTNEDVESVVSVLVGVAVADAALSGYLREFKGKGGFDQYVELAKADTSTLARLADFVSRSISAQSQALGTGGSSRRLSF